MRVRYAKEVARRWVVEEGSRVAGFSGAFYHGSVNWLPDEADFSTTSDLDVMVVIDERDPPNKPGKMVIGGVMLEVSYLPGDYLQSAEVILGISHLAGSFHRQNIILDPTGRLGELQAAVSREYARRKWVYKRCEHARDKVLNNLKGLKESEPFHDQVTSWLYATGVTTHMLLVAGLRNPTVRTRYVAVRQLLEEYERLDFYDRLLEMLRCAQMSRARVEEHLEALAGVFDAAKEVVKSPFFFASDISDIARPIAIDGSREMIERGDHREAVFWIVATYSRCQKVLYYDGTVEMQERYSPGYRRLVGDLGITSFADLQRRGEEVREFLPQVWEVAEAIMAANPEIED